MPVDVTFMVGGEAGQGVQSVGFLLAKVFARGGYHVFADQDYESRIRGGHSFFRVRVKDSPVGAIAEPLQVLIALNKETIDLHLGELVGDGVAIYDGEKIQEVASAHLFSVPIERLAKEKAGATLMSNTVALGAGLGVVGYDFSIIEQVLKDFFIKKPVVVEANIKAARAGYDHSRSGYKGQMPPIKPIGSIKRLLLSGTDAISLGALAAGCRFMAAYPMTPTSPIMEFMAEKAEEFNIAMVHAEDEISAVNMAIGASYAGVRSMTATSGSGFCLMTEGLGLAGITETPLVIIEGQRPGPAVGLPTRTEQGDLEFVLHAHHSEFPRAILAPATMEDHFRLTVKAFNLADKYQTPVIVMTDHHISTSYATVDPFDLSKVSIDRGEIATDSSGDPAQYKRHKVTTSGVSPRAFPGMGKTLVVTDADEHNEEGHLTESAKDRAEQVEKRQRKLIGMGKEIAPPRQYGPKEAETTLIGWGSTFGPLVETVDILEQEGKSVNLLHFNELYPFPVDAVTSALSNKKSIITVENNATAQLAHLMRAETGIGVTGKVLKYDGRPFSPALIMEGLRKEGI